MVIKLYISRISGNKEVKKKQQRVQMILDSKQIDYEAIDITEPGKEKEKEFMQQNGKVRESLGKYPLPPQIFNDDDFCGDYEDFDMANEVDELEKFLHMATNSKNVENESKVNGFQEQNSDIDKEKETEHKEDIEKSEVNGDVESAKSKSENVNVSETNEDIVAPVQEELEEEKQSVINDNAKDDKMDTEDNIISHIEEEESKKTENTEENVEKADNENENNEAEEKPQVEVEKEEIVDNNINETEEIEKEKSVNKENDDEDDNSSSQSEKSEED